jgi:hypothetical protein
MLSKKGALENLIGKKISIDKNPHGIYINKRHKQDLYYMIIEIGDEMFSATVYLKDYPQRTDLFSIDKVIGIDGSI